MAEQRKRGLIVTLVTTVLALLGLAGLFDAIVEWQNWFDQGVMQHWRSVKEWMSAVLFWWVPFHIPRWVYDYAVIGLMLARAAQYHWQDGWSDRPPKLDARMSDTAKRADLFISHYTRRFPIILFSHLLLWPVMLAHAVIMVAMQYPHADSQADWMRQRSLYRRYFVRAAYTLAAFIPVLFVCSTLLYELG